MVFLITQKLSISPVGHPLISATKCPPTQTYQTCSKGCILKCEDLRIVDKCKHEMCIPGCSCPSGQALSGNKCVLVAKCHCTSNGINFESGDEFQRDCKKW